MISLTIFDLQELMPHAQASDLARFLPHIIQAITTYEIDTPRRLSALIAIIADESKELSQPIELEDIELKCDPDEIMELAKFWDELQLNDYADVNNLIEVANRMTCGHDGPDGFAAKALYFEKAKKLFTRDGRASATY